MNAVFSVPKGQIVQVPNMRVPEQGAQALAFTVALSANSAVDCNLQDAFDTGNFDIPQSVFIDNSLSNSTTTLTIPGIGNAGSKIVAQPNTQGFYPLVLPVGDARFTLASAGGVDIPLVFFNVPMPYLTWGPISATATFTTPTGSFTDRSSNIAVGGTSQQLAAANANRKRIVITNPSTPAGENIAATEILYINFGAAAGIDNGTSFELLPGATWDSGSGPVSTQQINVNASTTNHVYIAKEM